MLTLSKEYILLFNAIADAEQVLTQLREDLIRAQREAEEEYLLRTDPAEKENR